MIVYKGIQTIIIIVIVGSKIIYLGMMSHLVTIISLLVEIIVENIYLIIRVVVALNLKLLCLLKEKILWLIRNLFRIFIVCNNMIKMH